MTIDMAVVTGSATCINVAIGRRHLACFLTLFRSGPVDPAARSNSSGFSVLSPPGNLKRVRAKPPSLQFANKFAPQRRCCPR